VATQALSRPVGPIYLGEFSYNEELVPLQDKSYQEEIVLSAPGFVRPLHGLIG